MAEGGSEQHHAPARTLPEALVRTLRHELGDFLQKVYATVAILKMRLPAEWEMELGLLTRLRARAETCRDFLDAAHDFVCPVILDCEPVDLAELACRVTATARQRCPQLNINIGSEAQGRAVVYADPRRAVQVGEALLANACAAAQSRVLSQLTRQLDPGEVAWTITDDGPGIAPELMDRLFIPFFTTNPGHAGLGLALARKLMALQGGRLTAGNLPEGGFRASAVFAVERLLEA
jgi:signal transduction histidine kinase